MTWSRIPLFWRFQLVGWTAYLVLSFPVKVLFLGTIQAAIITSLVRDGAAFLMTLGMWAIYRRAYARNRQLGWIALVVISVSLAAGLLLTLFSWALEHVIALEDVAIFGELNAIRLFYFCTSLAVGWSLLYSGIKFMRDAAERDLRLAQSENARREAELKMLRAQMAPHFLFNALNTIRAAIDQGCRELITLVEALSGYLRFSLAHRNDNFVTAQEEFDAITDYLTIEKARFRDELEIDCHFDAATCRLEIPGLLLQPLVENAIKYGRKTSPLPLRLEIHAGIKDDVLEMSVANTGTWEESRHVEATHGMALENLRHRLAILYPNRHSFAVVAEDGRVRVTLRIPIDSNP